MRGQKLCTIKKETGAGQDKWALYVGVLHCMCETLFQEALQLEGVVLW